MGDSYSEGNDLYEILVPMHLDKVLQRVEDEIASLNWSLRRS